MTPPPIPRSDLFIATHVAEASGPQHTLKTYLQQRGATFAYAACPFDYSKIPRALLTIFIKGKAQTQLEGHSNTDRGLVSWLKDIRDIWLWGKQCLSPRGVFIGFNNLNTAVGIVLKWFGFGRETIYFVVDYSHRRFSSPLLNWGYQGVARFAAKHADQVWSVSERIRDVNLRFGARPETSHVVPIGLDPEVMRPNPERKIDRHRLVILSTLFESKGVQLAIQAMPHLPQAKLWIIGTGPYENTLRQLAQELGVAKRVTFLGMLPNRQAFARVAQSRVALATYQTDPANYTHYADPAKPKEYLACGVPVVITCVPWIADPIALRPMGMAVEDQAIAVADACRKLMTDDKFWRRCRREALKFTQDLDWTSIFDRAVANLSGPLALTPARGKDRS